MRIEKMPGSYKWQNRFRGVCSRWTIPREAILELLSRVSGHMSAKNIYAALYPMYPGIGLTTIYRTLDLLTRTGHVNKITLGDGKSRYEFRSGERKDHHHHLICLKCGRIINYTDFVQEELELVKKIGDALAKKHNFHIQDHNIEFLGVCEKCR